MAEWLATHWRDFFVDSIATASFETQVLMLHPTPCRKNHTMGDVYLLPFHSKVVTLPPSATRPDGDQHPWMYA